MTRGTRDAGLPASARAALERACVTPDGLSLALQPIVDLQRGTIAGFEALARFPSPPRRGPDWWFSTAAELGLLPAVETRTATEAVALLSSLGPNRFLTFNLSPAAAADPDVGRALLDGGALDGLVIEITEQTEIGDDEALLAALEPLRAAGAAIAVDDTGAGYGSLWRITSLRPDFIKVDRSLVTEVHRDPAKAAALEALGALADRMDAWLVAEGIETPEEAAAAQAMGVPLGQGYLLGRPGAAPGDGAEARRQLREDAERLAAARPDARLLDHGACAASAARARARLAADPGADWVVVVRDDDRPVGLVARDDPAGAPLRGVSCRYLVGDPLPDLARRAMTRPAEQRFEPLVACDARGRFAGLLRIDRLLLALAGQGT